MQQGISWRVGDGRKIQVFKDHSVDDAHNTLVTTVPTEENEGVYVYELIDADNNCWNVEKIRLLLNDRDCDKILTIPISNKRISDMLIWRFDKKGVYTVRSAYRSLSRVTDANEVMDEGSVWRKLWGLDVPTKVKHTV